MILFYTHIVIVVLFMMPLAHCFRINTRFVTLAQAKARLLGRGRHFPMLCQANNYTVQASVNKPLVANVFVDKELVHSLSLKGKGRIKRYISNDGFKNHTISSLRERIENYYEELRDIPYKLRYRISQSNVKLKHNPPRLFNDDEDVNRVLSESYDRSATLHLFVQVNPGVFPVTDGEVELVEDPLESDTYTMLSFYCFHKIQDPTTVVEQLNALWRPYNALGRVYVSPEGVNAQMAVPTNVLSHFQRATMSLPLFEAVKLNTDHRISVQEFIDSQPFKQLHIKVREQIVKDGLTEPLDWSNKGVELSPLEWHRRLQGISSSSDGGKKNKKPIVLDCRNNYESDVGIFEHAIPLNTSLFKDSWKALDEVLKGADKDTPILTYCTGGIRCVKIGAYLQQKKGFTDVSSLKGGIIAYTRELEQHNENEDTHSTSSEAVVPSAHLSRHVPTSLFKGINYVFDERLGARVTEDVLAHCETCGEACDSYINCQNPSCNMRFIQCSVCRPAYSGCCSKSCQSAFEKAARETADYYRNVQANQDSQSKIVKNAVKTRLNDAHNVQPTPKAEVKQHAASASATLEALGTYADRYTSPEPLLLQDLRADTVSTYSESIARMLSGHLQGRLLRMIMQMTKARRVLELGAFTGYSTLCFAEGLSEGGCVVSCEPDETARNLANKYIDRSGLASKIDLRNVKASELIDAVREEGQSFDFVFIDADKKNYRFYLQSILGEDPLPSESDVTVATTTTDSTTAPNARCILNPGAIIMVDNTLWKGLVLRKTNDLADFAPRPQDYGDKARMQKFTDWIHYFNVWVAEHPQLEVVLVPMRDGLTLIRYMGQK